MSDLQLKLDLLVLDYLLSRRGLPTDVVLKFGSLLPQGTIEHLEGQTQARLMLRLLVDGHANGLSEDTITCLNIISSLPVRDGTATSFRPAPQLIKQVKEELIAQACREGHTTPDNLQSTIDHFYPHPHEAAEKAEVLNSFTTPAAAEKKLLAVNTRQATADAVVQYAQAAQALLGPSPLEALLHQGLVSLAQPAPPQARAQPSKKRGRPAPKKELSGGEGMPVAAEQAAVMAGPAQADSELAQRSKQLKAIGSDPAEGAQVVAANLLRQQQQHAQSAELLAAAQQQSHQIQQQQHHQHHQQQQQQSSFVADVQQAAAEPGSAALVEGGDHRGRVIPWDSPAPLSGINPISAALTLGSPNGHLHLGATALPHLGAQLIVRPLDSLAVEDGGSEGSKARRKVGRWREEETNELINLTQAHGRGKWKLILEKGSGIFQNRTQVDLKDKWRNLVRQGAVNPDLFPSPEGRSKPRAAVENEQRERDERSAAAAGGASHGQAAEVPHVENAQTLPHSQGASAAMATPGGSAEDPIEDSQTPSQPQMPQQHQTQEQARQDGISGMPLIMPQPIPDFLLPQMSVPMSFVQHPPSSLQLSPPAPAGFALAGRPPPQLHTSAQVQAPVSAGRQ